MTKTIEIQPRPLGKPPAPLTTVADSYHLDDCPFCGGADLRLHVTDFDYQLECKSCGATPFCEGNMEELSTKWNERARSPFKRFRIGQLVEKKSGSEWAGRIVGYYSTALTPEGYAVESMNHSGSVQIYPAGALVRVG